MTANVARRSSKACRNELWPLWLSVIVGVGAAVASSGPAADRSSGDAPPAIAGPADRENKPSAEIVSVTLPIPDRTWDPDRPNKKVGWCGETCIQMAMAYFGKEVSQKKINHAGSPEDPDLGDTDLSDALSNLDVAFIGYESNLDLATFIDWIKGQLRQGHPVLCGCKLYPTEHPSWYLDHFVLAVGFNDQGLILNTQLDLGGQRLVSYADLASAKSRYSFKNGENRYFARAIVGLR